MKYKSQNLPHLIYVLYTPEFHNVMFLEFKNNHAFWHDGKENSIDMDEIRKYKWIVLNPKEHLRILGSLMGDHISLYDVTKWHPFRAVT